MSNLKFRALWVFFLLGVVWLSTAKADFINNAINLPLSVTSAASGEMLIFDGTNWVDATMSGSCTMAAGGVITCPVVGLTDADYGDIVVSGVGTVMTIDAGVIVNADINASAAIDATKLVDGTVTSTELQYINTLSSNAQTQIDGKQASDAFLTSIGLLGTAADRMIYTTGIDTAAESGLSAFSRSFLDDADEATFKATVNLEAGTDFNAYDADLTTYAGITPSANVQTLFGAANYAAFKSSLSLGNVEDTALSTWAGTANITTLGTITTGTWNATDVPLSAGGTGATLADPGADRIGFWDDSAGAFTWLTAGTGLTITDTTITAASGGSGPSTLTTICGPTSPSGVATSSCTGISSTLYRDLVVTWTGLSNATATRYLLMEVSAGSGFTQAYVTRGTEANNSASKLIAGAGASSNVVRGRPLYDSGQAVAAAGTATGWFRIYDYANTHSYKFFDLYYTDSAGNVIITYRGLIETLNAIDGVQFYWNNTGNFDAGSYTVSGAN